MELSELYKLFEQHPTITTDSRDCPAGSIFFALKGASFDGNKFAAASLEKGCAYAVIDESEYAVDGDSRFIIVDDCLQTLQLLARYHRRQLGTPVIGITGTNGKTTTKELASAVLGEKYNVLFTQGNFNNDIGVPKTLLRLRPEHDIAVVEMGASHPGDIKTLVDIVEPDYAIITNVGRAHLQGFGSFEGVIRTKGELYDFMRAHIVEPRATAANAGHDSFIAAHPRTVFIDNDNQYLKGILHDLPLTSYGRGDEAELAIKGHAVSCEPMLSFQWNDARKEADHTAYDVETHLIGDYNLANMLAAVTIGTYFDVAPSQICHALSAYVPSNNRSQFEKTESNSLIVDAYNANPTSMAAALANFETIEAQHKMCIIGDMKELGSVSHDEHQRIVDQLAAMRLEQVWLVGEEFENCSTPATFRKFDNVAQVKEAIAEHKLQGMYILVKGSNGTRLFELPQYL